MPRHLGLIQDGHRRYAREAGLSNLKGYRLGATKAEEVLTWCGQLKIPMVTLWWLSTENLSREAIDVTAVLDVIEDTIAEWVRGGLTARLGIRIRPIGKLDLLPDSVLQALHLAASTTSHHERLLLNVAVGYGGRRSLTPSKVTSVRASCGVTALKTSSTVLPPTRWPSTSTPTTAPIRI